MHFDKKDMVELGLLIEQLQYPRNNLIMVLTAAAFIDDDVVAKMGKIHQCKYTFKEFGEVVIHPASIAKSLNNKEARGKVMLSAIWMGVRDIGCEPFEFVKDFCKKRNLFDSLMVKEPWYKYAKAIRNSLRHNKKFDLKENKQVRDVAWGSRRIPAAAHGKAITFEHFGPGDWFVLHDAILKFALSLPEKAKAIE